MLTDLAEKAALGAAGGCRLLRSHSWAFRSALTLVWVTLSGFHLQASKICFARTPPGAAAPSVTAHT